MTKAQKAIKELEAELAQYQVTEMAAMDMNKTQHPAKWFASMSFYQAQAFKKIFERLDEIEEMIKK